DPKMASNAILHQAKTGRLQGSVVPPDFDPLPATMPTGALLVHVVQGALVSPFHDVDFGIQTLFHLKSHLLGRNEGSADLTQADIAIFWRESKTSNRAELMMKVEEYKRYAKNYDKELVEFAEKARNAALNNVQMQDNPFVYKARPLDGIWATAPYLHNGSVP